MLTLTDSAAEEDELAWSPDSKQIAFTQRIGAQTSIMSVDARSPTSRANSPKARRGIFDGLPTENGSCSSPICCSRVTSAGRTKTSLLFRPTAGRPGC